MSSLSGKRILVAGGTGTVGRFLVQAQLDAGATVVVPSREDAKLEALRAALGVGVERLMGIVGDITDPRDAPGVLEAAGTLDGAVASLGRFVAAPSVFGASTGELEKAFGSYAPPHLAAAKTILPALEERGGGYVMVNGSLAFEPEGGSTGLVSVATAALSMLARVLMKERAAMKARINEVIIYSNLREDEKNEVRGADIARFVCYLLSDSGVKVKGETIHLRTREDVIPVRV